jgi:hypothetical protein
VQLQRRLASATDADFGRNVHHRAHRDVVERQFGALSLTKAIGEHMVFISSAAARWPTPPLVTAT